MQKKSNKLIYAVIFSSLLFIIDQVTKLLIIKFNINVSLIPNVLKIEIIQNSGGAFGIGQGNTIMFIISTFIILGLIIRFIFLQRDYMDTITFYLLSMIVAGGIGNLIDRLFRGYVIDFISIFPNVNFPKFNFADIYITVGWILLALTFAIYTYKEIKIVKK